MPQSQPRELQRSQATPIHFVVFPIIATVTVVARIWGRKAKGVKIWADDYLIITTLFVQHLILANGFLAIHYGDLGKDVADATADNPEVVENLLKCIFAFCLIYGLCSSLVKIAVLALYWRMIPTKAVKIGACVLGVVCIGWFITVELVTIFQCKPVAKAWHPSLDGECIDRPLFFVGNSIPNCVLDLTVWLLPTGEAMRLDLPMPKKIAIGCVFLLGGFVVAASAFRLAEATILYYNDPDSTLQQFLLPWFAATMEINLAIVSACLPTLIPAFRAIHEYWTSATKNLSSGTSSAGGEAKTPGKLTKIMAIGRIFNRNRIGALTTAESRAAAGRSFVRLDNVDSDVEALTPKGYSYERQTSIRSTREADTIRGEPIPLNGIIVKRDMFWAEGRKA
ncbi:hypothetical protein F5X99DRAFT_343623 [Biscogniauxia marginata]|nr:hypothetical protein F5X99DRAFT_343623 [Biscogniauxia marginata]